MSTTKVETTAFAGWSNCVRISNDSIELIVTTDVGPRIARFGFIGQNNELCEVKETQGLTGGNEWRIYGGHRLWTSPEEMPRTYEPDNFPVAWEPITNGIRTIQPVEKWTQIQKEMDITVHPTDSKVRILHRLINKGPWDVELSAWSISVMAPGGKEVVRQPHRDTGLLGNRVLALWPYSDMNDHRIHWGKRYIILEQDPKTQQPFKYGINNEAGWGAYFNNNHLFVKYFTHHMDAQYPDFGVSYETYTTDYMIEMETLSPLVKLSPGAKVEHLEKWELYDNVEMPSNDEQQIESLLKGRVVK